MSSRLERIRVWFGFREALAVLTLFSVLTLVFFHPLLSRLGSHLIGPPEDNMQFLWYLWYGTKAIMDPALPFFHTPLMYFPEGANLYFANYFYSGVAAAWILKPFLGLVLTYNFLVLSSFALSGLTAYWLIQRITGSAAASILGGFVYAFNPQHFEKSLHHVHLASIQFIPLFVLFLLRSRSEPSRLNIFLAGTFLAVSALCDWNYLVYGFLILLFDWAYSHAENRTWFDARAWTRAAGIGGCAFALSAFVLVPMIGIGLRHGWGGTALPGIDTYVADFAGFWMPNTNHWLASLVPALQSWNAGMTGNVWEKTAYLGLANIGLAVFIWIRNPRQAAYFGWALVFTLVLAMGVRLHFLGSLERFTIPLPYQILDYLPFFKQARNPARIMAFAYLFLAVLTGLAAHAILSKIRTNGLRAAAFALLAAVLVADFFQVARSSTPVELPGYYRVIRADYDASEKKFGLLNIPWEQARFSMYQTLHEMPDAQGYMGHKLGKPLVGRIPFAPEHLAAQQKLLAQNSVKYVVIHKKRITWDPRNPEDLKFFSAMSRQAEAYAKFYPKVYEDDAAAVFRVYP